MAANNIKYLHDLIEQAKNENTHPAVIYEQVVSKMSWFEANKIVYKYFFEKYFRPLPPKKPDLILNLKNMFPGKMYTFMYTPDSKDILDFYDTRPIILNIKSEKNDNTNNLINFGLNFNFIPVEIKQLMIEALWDGFTDIIHHNIHMENKSQIMQQKPIFIDSYDYMQVLDNMWEYTRKSAYRFALRNYIYTNAKYLREIDYCDYGLISFINSKDIIGKEPGEIYKEYWAYKLTKDRQLKKGPKRNNDRKRLK